MAPKKKNVDKDKLVRPILDGALAEALQFDTEQAGLKNPIDTVRMVLTAHYRAKKLLSPGADGKLVFTPPDDEEE